MPLPLVALLVIAALATDGVNSAAPVNLAYKKTAYQIDEIAGGKPGRAVDGNKNSDYNGNSCTATDSNSRDLVNNNWWAVDLVDRFSVQKVVVYNRGYCSNCGDRLANFDIVVTDTKPTKGKKLVYSSNQVCAHKTGAVAQGKTGTFNCNKQLQGRYVAVVQSRKQILTLCEVEVFGTPAEDISLCASWLLLGPTTEPKPKGLGGLTLVATSGTSLTEGPDGLNAWVFTGKNYVKITSGGQLNLAKESFTIATYVYQDTVKDGPIVEWRGGTGLTGTHVWVWRSKLYINLDAANTYHVVPQAKKWHFVGVSFNHKTGNLMMWVDGNVLNKATGTSAVRDMAGDLYVGFRPTDPKYKFTGKLAGTTLMNCAVNKDQIEELKKLINIRAKPACSFGFTFDEKTKECVDRCPDYQQRWDGTKCAVRCIASQKWNGQKCVAKCQSPLKYNAGFGTCEAKTCRCYANGDPHYYQYDGGRRIDFMGKCKYTFTKLKDEYKNDKCYFNVEEKNVHLGNTRVSYVKLVDVTVEDMTFRYSDQTKKVYIDGIDRTKSKFPISVKTKKGTEVRISYANRLFKVEAAACYMVTSYRSTFIETLISSTIGNKVEGICGTCNGNKNDDLIPRGQTKATGAGAFSDSWSVPDDSGLQPQGNCKSADVNGDCIVAWAKKVQDNNHCGYITDKNGPFKACIASGLVDVKQFQGSCEFDVCFYSKERTAATDVPEVVCKNLAAFADACAKQGLGGVWRRANFCPLQCEVNAYYSPKMYSGCEKTCQQRTAPKDCVNDEPEDGCTCKNGYFRLGNDCVLPAKCGCDASDGQHIDSGKSVVTKGCTAKYECTAQGTLKKLALPACHKDASCSAVNGLYACKCNDGYNGNGHSCTTNCPKAEEKWDTKSSKCVLHCPDKETKWNGNTCVPRCPDVQTKWDGKICILRCSDPDTHWSTTKATCILRCQEAKWDKTKGKCVDRCGAEDKWDDAKKDCIARCPAEKKWTINKCVDRCTNAAEQWSQVEKKCIPRCPDVNTMWDKPQGKCVNRCKKHMEWDNNAQKCTERCAAADKWDEAKKRCVSRCPAHREWKGAKCMDRCTDQTTTWSNEKKACVQRCTDSKTMWDQNQGKCVDRCSSAQLWEVNLKKCVDRCVAADKWNEASKKCEPRCPASQLWKMEKCVNRCGTGEKWHEATTKCYQDPKYPQTEGGNAGGAGCAIPFLYGGKWQADCIQGSEKKWCGTTENYDADRKWGYCLVACPTQRGERKIAGESWMYENKKYFCDQKAEVFEIKNENINTKDGGKCVCPFKYASKYYGECIGNNPWCATTADYDADSSKWGYCSLIATCQTQDQKQVKEGETWSHGGMEYSCGRDGKARKNVKTSAGNCLFPFTYKGTTYQTCTEAASSGKPWCYIDAAESAYGYC